MHNNYTNNKTYVVFTAEIPESEPCDNEPCFNGGICIPNGDDYRCRCKPGFEGFHCETGKLINYHSLFPSTPPSLSPFLSTLKGQYCPDQSRLSTGHGIGVVDLD